MGILRRTPRLENLGPRRTEVGQTLAGPSWLTDAETEAVAYAVEECSELTKAGMKALRHGKRPTDGNTGKSYDNQKDLEEEAGDVLAAIMILQHVGLVSKGAAERRALDKLGALHSLGYMHHIDLGLLASPLAAEIKA
jgi:NTP pyrophosphatase (non-canonical NTP hydrolase)